MPLVATDSGGGDFEKAPQGTHLARCVQVIDLGHQRTTWEGKERESHKILLGFELPTEHDSEGAPFLVWRRYTLSLGQASHLRRDLEAWRSRPFTSDELQGFDITTVLGVPCLLAITHNVNGDRTYVDINSVMAPPKGQECPPQISQSVLFVIDNWDRSVFDTFSDRLKETIMSSRECQQQNTQAEQPRTAADHVEENASIPF